MTIRDDSELSAAGWLVDGEVESPIEHVLFVCTANQCRSPIAEALLVDGLLRRGGESTVSVSSAGLMAGGMPADPYVVKVLAGRRIDARSHRSARLTTELVERADLILTMERSHAREAVVLSPGSFGKTFTIRDFCERLASAGVRGGATLPDYVSRVGSGRARSVLMGSGPDEVADPKGKSLAAFDKCTNQLHQLIDEIGHHLWGWSVSDRPVVASKRPSAWARLFGGFSR